MKLKLLFPLLILFCINLTAQDVYFYQFQYAPVQLSPTLSGTSSGTRINLNYQNDLGMGSLDKPFVLENGDIVGVGGKYLFQKIDRKNKFSQLGLIANYQKKIFKNSANKYYVIFGIEAAVDKRRDRNNLFIQSKKNSIFFGDFSTGIALLSKFKNNFKIHIGTSYFHLNEPNLNFDRSSNNIIPLYTKFVFHGLFEIPIGKRIIINPKFLYSSQKSIWIHESSFLLITNSDIKIAFNKQKQSYIIFGIGIESTSLSEASSLSMNSLSYKFGYENKKIGVHFILNDSKNNFVLFDEKFWEGTKGISLIYKLLDE